MIKTLGKSELGAALLDYALLDCKSCLVENAQTFNYEYQQGICYYNPHLPDADKVLCAALALRQCHLKRTGALVNPMAFHPDTAILINRLYKADEAAVMCRVAWELMLAGERGPWDRLTRTMESICRQFAIDANSDFRKLWNGDAMSTALECWFIMGPCDAVDKEIISLMLADYRGYIFEGRDERTDIAETILGIGVLPGRRSRNYLAPYVQTIMEDAVFSETRSRSNSNFLWFIKFERDFRAQESTRFWFDDGAGTSWDDVTAANKVIDFPKDKVKSSEVSANKAQVIKLQSKRNQETRSTCRYDGGGPDAA